MSLILKIILIRSPWKSFNKFKLLLEILGMFTCCRLTTNTTLELSRIISSEGWRWRNRFWALLARYSLSRWRIMTIARGVTAATWGAVIIVIMVGTATGGCRRRWFIPICASTESHSDCYFLLFNFEQSNTAILAF